MPFLRHNTLTCVLSVTSTSLVARMGYDDSILEATPMCILICHSKLSIWHGLNVWR